MLFHANNIQNRAVWNAMQLHAKLITDAGEELIFIVYEKNYPIVYKDFPKNSIITYKNPFELIKKVISSKESQVFAPDFISVLSISTSKLIRKVDIYYWIQGIIPEESYMRHQSKLRKNLLSLFESMAIRLSSYQIVVSTYMREFLEKKYALKLNSIVVPCTSDLSYTADKKIPHSFVYVGGLSAWQKFDQILLMFNKISKANPEARLYVATGDEETAMKLCHKYLDETINERVSIQNINDRVKMEEFLNDKQYGFLIRDDDPVNNVSSPIKLAEYLSTGTNVIISDSITSYAPKIEKYGAGFKVETINDVIKITNFTASAERALELYEYTFSKNQLVKEYKSIL